MRKSESLAALELLGLNTIDYFITEDPKEATHYLAKHVLDRRSMRTERGDEFMCPFYYNLPGESLLPLALKHIGEGYKLIFSPSLDSKDCTAFGTVALTGELKDWIEYVNGPGLVRELDTHPNKVSVPVDGFSLIPVKGNGSDVVFLNTVYKLVAEHCHDQVPCVLEWSRYPYRVGKLQKYFIFWELRGYK
jgi:hypothetical protein